MMCCPRCTMEVHRGHAKFPTNYSAIRYCLGYCASCESSGPGTRSPSGPATPKETSSFRFPKSGPGFHASSLKKTATERCAQQFFKGVARQLHPLALAYTHAWAVYSVYCSGGPHDLREGASVFFLADLFWLRGGGWRGRGEWGRKGKDSTNVILTAHMRTTLKSGPVGSAPASAAPQHQTWGAEGFGPKP